MTELHLDTLGQHVPVLLLDVCITGAELHPDVSLPQGPE